MKTLYSSIALLFICQFGFAQQDSITNGGFERWTTVSSYDDPDGWTTLNPAGVILGAEMAFPATAPGEFHSGSTAAKLVTANVDFFGITPSVLTTGEINTGTQEIEGGWPISSRPDAFGGWFRFDPNGVDTAFVNIALTRWDANSGMRETVGFAESDIFSTDSLFENIELNIDYTSNEIPDTVLIMIGSGGLSAQENSTLFVDDLHYYYSTDITSAESVDLKIYPNPTSDILSISSNGQINFKQANIYSVDGRVVSQVILSTNTNRINVNTLPRGSYIIELISQEGALVRQKFLKE